MTAPAVGSVWVKRRGRVVVDNGGRHGALHHVRAQVTESDRTRCYLTRINPDGTETAPARRWRVLVDERGRPRGYDAVDDKGVAP